MNLSRPATIRLLLIDDNDSDAELTRIALSEIPLLNIRHVRSVKEFKEVIKRNMFDVIVCDYHLHDGYGTDVLDFVKKHFLDLPFIIISGALGDERAVEVLRKGADDYVLKDNIRKLPLSLKRVIRESEIEKQRQIANAKLRISEETLKSITNHIPDIIFSVNRKGNIIYCNRDFEGISMTDLPGMKLVDVINPGYHKNYKGHIAAAFKGQQQEFELPGLKFPETKIWYSVRMAPEIILGNIDSVLVIVTDISGRKDSMLREDIINQISKVLNEEVSVNQFLEIARSQMSRIMPVDNFYVSRYDPPTKNLTFIFQYLNNKADKSIPFSRRNGNGLSEYVLNTKRSLLLTGPMLKDFYRKTKVRIYLKQVKCWLGVPVLFENEVIGVIAVQSFTNDFAFSQRDMEILSFVGSQLGAFIRRQDTERKLKDSQAKWDSLVQNSGDIICTINKNNSIISINRISEELGDISLMDTNVVGKDFLRFVTKSNRGHVKDAIENAIRNGVDTSFVLIERLSGRYFDCRATPLIQNEQLQGLIVIMRDVTQLMMTQQDLIESEERYKTVVQDQIEYIVRWKPDGKIVFANQSYLDFNELSLEELLKKNYYDLIPPNERKRFRKKILSLSLDNPVQIDTHESSRGKTGRFWHEWVDRAFFDSKGKVVEYQSVGRDITVQKQAEIELRKSEEISLAVIMGKSINEIADITVDGVVNQPGMVLCGLYLFNNDSNSWQLLSEKKKGDLISKIRKTYDLRLISLTEVLLVDEIRDCIFNQGNNYITSDPERIQGLFVSDLRQLGSALTHQPIEYKLGIKTFGVIPLFSGGMVVGVISFFSSERIQKVELNSILRFTQHASGALAKRKAEDELRLYKDNLEKLVEMRTKSLNELNRELESFNYSVSHDLRTPIRAIDIYRGLLEQELKDTDHIHYIHQIERCTNEMNNLIKAMLEFSRMSKVQLSMELIDLNELIPDIFERQIEYEGGVKTQLKLKKLPLIWADRNLMTIVFNNLLSNAIKYSAFQQSPVVEIGVRPDNDNYVFYVRDNGVGFNIKHSDKLFKPFSRLHHGDQFKGTGAGLAIVERILTRHNGRIYAESEINKGSVFYFTIPKRTDQIAA